MGYGFRSICGTCDRSPSRIPESGAAYCVHQGAIDVMSPQRPISTAPRSDSSNPTLETALACHESESGGMTNILMLGTINLVSSPLSLETGYAGLELYGLTNGGPWYGLSKVCSHCIPGHLKTFRSAPFRLLSYIRGQRLW